MFEGFDSLLKDCWRFPKIEKGEVGVEIETEGENLVHEIPNHWKVHEDGSLRGRDQAEYVLKKPVERDKIRHVLEYLAKKLEQNNSLCSYSWRTSVHVHVNMLEEKLKDIYNYICLYTLFEDVLSEYCGPTRVGNLFCLRMKDAEFLLDFIKKSLRDVDGRKFNPIEYYNTEEIRYAAVNLCALVKYGSLEFRAYRGTNNVDDICNWIHILLNLKDSARLFKNPQEIVEKVSMMGPEKFVDFVLDKESKGILGLYLDYKSVYKNVRYIQDIAYATNWEVPKLKAAHQKNIDDFNEILGRANERVRGLQAGAPNIIEEELWQEDVEIGLAVPVPPRPQRQRARAIEGHAQWVRWANNPADGF